MKPVYEDSRGSLPHRQLRKYITGMAVDAKSLRGVVINDVGFSKVNDGLFEAKPNLS